MIAFIVQGKGKNPNAFTAECTFYIMYYPGEYLNGREPNY